MPSARKEGSLRATRLLLAALAAMPACVTTPMHVLELADAESDSAKEEAAEKASAYLADEGRDPEVRRAAAKTLGRLRAATPDAIARLGRVLQDPGADPVLRAFSAWALGEMRSDRSLPLLVLALRTSMDGRTGHYVLDAIAKHDALLAKGEDRLVEIVEAMVFFAGNQRGRPPAIYDVLGSTTRTVPVDVRVLARAIDSAVSDRSNDAKRAAVYNAVYELLARLERSRAEITAGSAAWKTQVEAAVKETDRAYALGDPYAQALALWYLGRLGDVHEVAAPAANLLVGEAGDLARRPSIAKSDVLRFVAAWALARMQLEAPGPRRTLARDVLPKEGDGAILRLLADYAHRPEDHDQIQKILGAGEREEGRK
jgi:HEAT repeat protein